MAHIQHLGACLLHCGAQPRLLPRAAVRRACPVHCLNAPASWSAERELRFGGESAAVAAHSKTSFTSTERVDLSRTVLFMSSRSEGEESRPTGCGMRDSSAYGLRMTGHQSKKEKARRVGTPSFSPFFAVRLTGRTRCVNLALAFPLGE